MLRHVLLLFIKSNASVLSFAVPKYYHMKELGSYPQTHSNNGELRIKQYS